MSSPPPARLERHASHIRPVVRLHLSILVMTLAATMVPIELRSAAGLTLNLNSTDVVDMVANLTGYLPVGVALAGAGMARALLAAFALSVLAEVGQFWMQFRDPSAVDIATNTLGAALGLLAARRFDLAPEVVVTRSLAVAACVAAIGLVAWLWGQFGSTVSDRGLEQPGTLEASWPLDGADGRQAADTSGHGLHGRFHRAPSFVPAPAGSAARFDGSGDYVDLGRPAALRLAGSMTVSAWIKADSFPVDDASIVSSYNGAGYQLDTTVDTGPRTVGFKLGGACGAPMSRYGATPLKTGTWYHVAGVYDAGRKTIDVYLDGVLDNGVLEAPVTSRQMSTRETVYIGRRSDSLDFGFRGAISDVRIFSRALGADAIAALMRNQYTPTEAASDAVPTAGVVSLEACAPLAQAADARAPGAAALLGVLAALAGIGLARSRILIGGLMAGGAAGAALALPSPTTLTTPGRWIVFVVALAGAAGAVLGVRRG